MFAYKGALTTIIHLAMCFFPTSSLGHFYFNDFPILNHSIVPHDLWGPKAVFNGALGQVVAMEAKEGEEQGLSEDQICRSQGLATNERKEKNWNVISRPKKWETVYSFEK